MVVQVVSGAEVEDFRERKRARQSSEVRAKKSMTEIDIIFARASYATTNAFNGFSFAWNLWKFLAHVVINHFVG